jgi:hypothetical protein
VNRGAHARALIIPPLEGCVHGFVASCLTQRLPLLAVVILSLETSSSTLRPRERVPFAAHRLKVLG